MELLLFRPADFERLYGCQGVNVSAVPLEQRQNALNGWALIAVFFLTEIIYIPCMCSIWKRMDTSCYKLLFYIGVADMLVLFVCCLASGYFAVQGYVFCSSPKLVYVIGTLAMGFWAAESVAELTLALDRCLEMSFPHIAEKMFSGTRVYIWLALGTGNALFWWVCTTPVQWTGIYQAWFFDPYVGYLPDTGHKYHNYLHSVHNIFMAIAFPLVYTLFGIKMALSARVSAGRDAVAVQRSVNQKMMFIQVASISFFNCYACLLYVYMQYFPIKQALIYMAHWSWVCIHAIPPFIYLGINKTIRNDCRRALGSFLFKTANRVHHASTNAPFSQSNRVQVASINFAAGVEQNK